MTFCFLPMNVFATSIREAIANAHKEVMKEIEQAGDYRHQKIIGENVEKRTRNEKHYILADRNSNCYSLSI